jgi:hypothetical protein
MGVHSQDTFPLQYLQSFLASLFTVSNNSCDAKFLKKYLV